MSDEQEPITVTDKRRIDPQTGQVRGTCQIFTQVGQHWPFYSYRVATLTKHSEALRRTFRAEILNLVNDLEGASEVGGLFLHPGERAGGLGLLLAWPFSVMGQAGGQQASAQGGADGSRARHGVGLDASARRLAGHAPRGVQGRFLESGDYSTQPWGDRPVACRVNPVRR